MSAYPTAARVLLAIGIIGLVKAVLGVARPSIVRRFGTWWAKAALQVNTLTGLLCIVLGAALWACVLYPQPLTHWLVLAFGALAAWAGSVYLRRELFTKLMRGVLLDRSDGFVRTVFLIGGLVSVLLIWVAARRM